MLLVMGMLGMTEYFKDTPDNQPNNQQDDNEIIGGQFDPYYRDRGVHRCHLSCQRRKKEKLRYPSQT